MGRGNALKEENHLLNQQVLIEQLLSARQPFRRNVRNTSVSQSTYPQGDQSLISEITRGPESENYSYSIIAKDLFQ